MKSGVHFIRSVEEIPSHFIELQVGTSINKSSLLRALSEACHFPNYFGHNWDAAWESLADISDHSLLLRVEPGQQITQPDLDIFIDMIDDASREYGHPELWVVGYTKTLRLDEDDY